MKLLIVSSAPLIYQNDTSYAYAPYVNELVIWEKYSDEIIFACPVWETDRGLLISEIPFKFNKHFKLIDLNLNSVTNTFKAIFQSVYNFLILFKAMKNADHIHFRCPGNIGLIGSFAQIFFPRKIKTTKYAGNWDLKSKQPWTYRLQKWILSNTFLTHNMQVLVYGDWKNQSKNIKPFFTATYSDAEKEIISKTNFEKTIEFIFVGSLVTGKNPMYAIQLIEKLVSKNYKVILNLYGDGVEKDNLLCYIKEKGLENAAFLNGNQDKQTIKKAYQKSHFVLLPSKSEGWPKAIAEGMFWGCVPLATKVSCVPFMLDNGNRGVLLEMKLDQDLNTIIEVIQDENLFLNKSRLAAEWSQKYTTDVFESEIKKLLVK